MGTLEQVMDLKSKGTSDSDIISILKEQGISPKAISEALSQAKIKGAVSSGNGNDEGMERSILRPDTAEDLPTEGSISDEDLTPPPRGLPAFMQQRSYVPLHQEEGEEVYVPQPQEDAGNYNTQAQGYQYQPQEYTQQEGSEYQPGAMASSDTDTIIEISEQVFAERMKGAVKQLESLIEFKTLSETKIENISHRLARLEASIDKLQIAILEKVGSYGRGLDTVKKEMEMVEDSFSKIVNKVAEKHSGAEHYQTQHLAQQHHTQSQPQHTTHRIEKKTTVVHKSQKPAAKKHSKK
ncbi:MAG: hypothetical protein AABX91_00360 [Nanoarchaeota archaeon]